MADEPPKNCVEACLKICPSEHKPYQCVDESNQNVVNPQGDVAEVLSYISAVRTISFMAEIKQKEIVHHEFLNTLDWIYLIEMNVCEIL